MTFNLLRTTFATAVLCTVAGIGALGQQGRGSAPPPAADWPMHNRDVRSTRYSPLDEINASNVSRLAVSWSFQPTGGLNISSTTPLVVQRRDVSELRVAAVRARCRNRQGDLDVPGRSGRFAAAAAVRSTATAGSTPSAIPICSPSTRRPASLCRRSARAGWCRSSETRSELKYPGKYAADFDPTTVGYSMTTPPSYWNGTLYLGMPFSDSLLPGGLVVAVDGITGAIKWVFNTVPQGPQDDGWEITKDTFSGARYGAGIWVQPAIDPELGLIYVNTGNATPNYDGSSRKGMNLFTNSVARPAARHREAGLALPGDPSRHLGLGSGRRARCCSTRRSMAEPSRGVGSLGKNCHAYFFDRETGKPLNPIVETAMPTQTDVPGEEVWPTQPIPYTSSGLPLMPFCSTYPIVKDPELAKRVTTELSPVPGERVRHYRSGKHRRLQLRLALVQPADRTLLCHRQERRVVDQGEAGRRHVEARSWQPGPLRCDRRAGRHRGDADAGAGGLRAGERPAGLVRRASRERRTEGAWSPPATSSSSRAAWSCLPSMRGPASSYSGTS